LIKNEFLKFIIIGSLSTLLNYAIFYTIYNFFNLNYALSSGFGFIVGVFMGYRLNKTWTFEIKVTEENYVYKYYFVYTASLFLSLIFLDFLVSKLSIIPEIANILTIGLTTCTNFIGTKFWAFKK